MAVRVRATPFINRSVAGVLRALRRRLDAFASYAEMHLPRSGMVAVPVTADRDLMLLSSEGDGGLANLLWWRGADAYEPEVAAALVALARPDTTVLDIGANIGIHSLLLAARVPWAEVHAFEPAPAAFRRLAEHVRINSLSGRVTCRQLAAGRARGEAELFADGAFDMMASTSQAFRRARGPNPSLLVEVVSLDDYVDEHALAPIGIVKIDVEGAEADVLQGLTRTLARDGPAVIVEMLEGDPGCRASSALLHDAGYTDYLLTPGGPVSMTPGQTSALYPNHLFLRVSAEELRTAYPGLSPTRPWPVWEDEP